MNKKRKEKNVQKESYDQTRQVKALMIEGKLLYENNQYEQALRVFSNAISKSSSAQIFHLNHIYHLKGLCEFKLRQYQRAERDFQEAISISDEKSKIEFYISLGKCKLEQAIIKEKQLPIASLNIQLQEAIRCFQKSLEFSNHTEGQAYFHIGVIYKKLKKNFQAIKQFNNAIKYSKIQDQYKAYIQKGICYRDIGDVQNSINDFAKALEIRRDDPYGNLHLAINHLLQQNYDEALQKLSTAIQLHKSEPKFHNYKGLVLFMSGQYESSLLAYYEAIKYYEEQNQRNNQVAECHYNIGNALINLGRFKESLNAFSNAHQYQTDQQLQIKLLYAQGRALQMLNASECITKFQECLELQLNFKSDLFLATLYHLASCQAKIFLLDDAIQSFTKIIQSECNDKCVYQERGKTYLKNQMYKEALKDFQVVVNLDESYADIYYYRGMSKVYQENQHMIQEALKDFFKAIQLGSKHIAIYNGISCAYLQAKKYQKALIYSNICLSAHPSVEQFLIQRSLIYIQLEQYNKAIQDLTTALTVNNKNPIIYYRRGLAYYKNKQFQKAIIDLERSLKFNPNRNIQADIYYYIGIANSNLEKYHEAIQPLTKAINMDNKAKYYHERAKCQILTDQNLQALNDLNEVIKSQPKNAFAYFRRGFAHKALRLYEEAAQDFLRARQLKPDDPRLIINKKQIYQTKYRKLCNAGYQE